MEAPRESEQADVDQAPEGAAAEGRPDTGDADRALRDEGAPDAPDAEQQDPESGPASLGE